MVLQFLHLAIALCYIKFHGAHKFDDTVSLKFTGAFSHKTSICFAEDAGSSLLTPKVVARNDGSTKNASICHQSSCLYCG